MKSVKPLMRDQVRLVCQRWEAYVLPTFGANVISLLCEGQPVLRTPQTLDQLKDNPHLYGMPLLFPPNRVKDARFAFEGKPYALVLNEPTRNNHIHGLMADAPFLVLERDDRMVRCLYQNRGKRFPFDFDLEVTIRLEEAGLRQSVCVRNTGIGAMPVALGFHTTFLAPAQLRVPLDRAWEVDEYWIPTGRLRSLSAQETEIVSGCNPNGRRISGFYTMAGQTAQIGRYQYCVSEGYTQWVLFNGGGTQGYICVEPQSGPVNGLNMPDGCRRLESGQSLSFWMEITRPVQLKNGD